MKSGHVGLAIIINKYDGIDLPGDACRLLVIDGLPNIRSEYDAYEQNANHKTDEYVVNKFKNRTRYGKRRKI